MKKLGIMHNATNNFVFKILYEYLICRLEKVVFGDPSDVVNNLLDDQSVTKIINVSVDTENQKVIEDHENNSDQDISVLNDGEDTKLEEKKAVWIDDDDYNYTYV